MAGPGGGHHRCLAFGVGDPLVERLLHRAEIVNIEGSSYRLKEAKERAAAKAKARASRPKSRQAG